MYTIQAVEVDDPIDLESEILSDRVIRGQNNKTREFKILRGGSVVGLLIYEGEGQLYDFIYEIFVLAEFRGSGVGTWILMYAEQIAARLGRSGVRLIARSLFQDELNDDDLTSWYEGKGYVRSPTENSMLEKRFSLAPS